MTATAHEPTGPGRGSGPAESAGTAASAARAASAGSARPTEPTGSTGTAFTAGSAVSAGSADPATPIVRLDDVRKDFGDTAALDGVTLHIRQGEAVAVMGPSGCGKSTLLNLVAGLDRPSSGDVVVHGEDLGRLSETGLALFRRRRIGMIFQFFNLIDDLPALDNVALAAQLTGVPAGQARRRAMELLGELGIADRKNTYPAQLSGGERQRVAVARALMNRPALLLADEPTGALDSRSGEQVMDLLIDLNQLGQTLLMVTHDPRLAARCANRLVEVADGRIVAERALGRTA